MSSRPAIGPLPDFGFLPQRKVRPDLFAPHHLQVPQGRLRVVTFQFPNTAARVTLEATETLPADWVMWGMLGYSDSASGFRLLLKHTIAQTGKERLLYKTHAQNVNALGTAKSPFLLPETHFVAAGDTLFCEIKNQATSGTPWIEVDLYGVEPGQDILQSF